MTNSAGDGFDSGQVVEQTALAVHPSVVFKLGEDLITDNVQAVLELMKNAYDADASSVTVTVDRDAWFEEESGGNLTSDAALSLLTQRSELAAECGDLEKQIDRLANLTVTATNEQSTDAGSQVGGETSLDLLLEDSSPALDTQTVANKLKALRVRLRVVTDRLSELPQPVQGAIVVDDRGTGMTLEMLKMGWLTVSASPKRRMKLEGRTTPRGRTPLGDKGLGRLGAQRLGRSISVVTKTADAAQGLACRIVWSSYDDAESLAAVPISIEEASPRFKHGTTITIQGLSRLSDWDDPAIASLQVALSTMLSPYRDDLGFAAYLRVDGQRVDLRGPLEEVLNSSVLTYDLQYRETTLEIATGIRSSYLRPDRSGGPDAMREYERYVATDNGHRFLEFIFKRQPKKAAAFDLRHGDDKVFCLSSSKIVRDSFTDLETDPNTGAYIDPGPFDGRVDLLQRRHVHGPLAGRLDEIVGVRVYRDGFGIRLAGDWLDFAAQWSTGKSWYTIRPNNVIGFINLSAADNAALEETSDRETFRDTAAYRNFHRYLGRWLAYTSELQTFIRDQYRAFVSAQKASESGIDPNSSSGELRNEVDTQLSGARKAAGDVRAAATAADRALDDLNTLRWTLTPGEAPPNQQPRDHPDQSYENPEDGQRNKHEDVGADGTNGDRRNYEVSENSSAAFESLEKTLFDLREQVNVAEERLGPVTSKAEALELLMRRLEDAETQIAEMWDLISLGLTAESISHEVKNVTDRLIARSKQIRQYNDTQIQDPRFAAYIENVRTSARSLVKQVSHLDTSMRYRREDRTTVRVSELMGDYLSYISERWRGLPLQAELNVKNDFVVTIATGKLNQVLDNLFLNSEYWMQRGINTKQQQGGTLTVTVNEPIITIADDGPGVDPSVQSLLFDPFVTRKPNRDGRGLGLYVTRNLLESEGASISLNSARNHLGRAYGFDIDLGALITKEKKR